MAHRAILTTDAAVRDYLLAGRSTITVLNKRTNQRYTYKVTCKRAKAADGRAPKSPYYVSVMSGSDNVSDYSKLGWIPSNAATLGRHYNLRPSKGGISTRSQQYLGFQWLWNAIHGLNIDGSKRKPSDNHIGQFEHVEVWHEGKCGCCGRKLTVPESIESGIGPICAGWYKALKG
jgi:hypothetical protein